MRASQIGGETLEARVLAGVMGTPTDRGDAVGEQPEKPVPQVNCTKEKSTMYLLDQKTVGIVLLVLLGMLVIVKQLATGSMIEMPTGSRLLRLTNSFNLFFLLVVNPLAAILLITGDAGAIDPTHMVITSPWLAPALEIAGLVLTVVGYLLMAWALICLGRRYQLGGNAPRQTDQLTIVGPYKLVRHPMYSAVLCISLGLACLLQSWAFLAVFVIYLVLLGALIPVEEAGLQQAYGEPYSEYQHKVRKLVPLVY
jgi:protein-S-isoprenylcysteine O-methyltransferase